MAFEFLRVYSDGGSVDGLYQANYQLEFQNEKMEPDVDIILEQLGADNWDLKVAYYTSSRTVYVFQRERQAEHSNYLIRLSDKLKGSQLTKLTPFVGLERLS